MIEIKDVTKRFQDKTVLDSVNATFEPGAIHGVIGRNGSGKTILLKCICGFARYDSGTIALDSQVIGKDIEMPRSLGCIIETPGFIPHLSGYKNLLYLASLRAAADTKAIEDAMETVGLDPFDRKRVGKYSLGMRQRLAIAQAVMEDPALLVLDEPLSGIDKAGTQSLRRFLRGLCRDDRTVIMASHNSEDIDRLCDTVHEIDDGHLRPVR